jgi:hypothetical protein
MKTMRNKLVRVDSRNRLSLGSWVTEGQYFEVEQTAAGDGLILIPMQIMTPEQVRELGAGNEDVDH